MSKSSKTIFKTADTVHAIRKILKIIPFIIPLKTRWEEGNVILQKVL